LFHCASPPNGEKYLVEMSSATLTNINGLQAKNPDLTIIVNAVIDCVCQKSLFIICR